MIAITRGGIVPAALVAREFDIRLVDTICVTSCLSSESGEEAQTRSEVKIRKGVSGDGYLLIDDLVDSDAPPRSFVNFCRKLISRRFTSNQRVAPWWIRT